jgi:hypothetical protein
VTQRDAKAAGVGAGGAAAAPAGNAAADAAPPPYNPPPAFMAAPAPAFDPSSSDPYHLRTGEQTTLPPSAVHTARDPDIALPFDDLPAPARRGLRTGPVARANAERGTRLPPRRHLRRPRAPMPSSVASEDTFCGVCGYRLK